MRIAHNVVSKGELCNVTIDTKTNRILGAAVFASEGAELAHLYMDLMNSDPPYTVIRDGIYIHPTLAEAI